MSLDATTEDDAGAAPQVSDADEAAHARDMAAVQMQRASAPRNRRTAVEPPQQQETAAGVANDNNPYAQFVNDPPDNGVALMERTRLNRQEAFYRGTALGSSRLAMMANLFQTPDGPEVDPARKKVNKGLRDEYQGIVSDLAAYDLMKPWGSTLEAATALGGQLEGSLLSPESWLGWGAKGATFLARTGKAALQQAAIQGTADPIVQALSASAGVKEGGWDPMRTATAAGMGALIGGGAHALGEGLGHVIGQGLLRRQLRDLATEDPEFVGIAPHDEAVKPGPADATGTETPKPEEPTEPAEAAKPEAKPTAEEAEPAAPISEAQEQADQESAALAKIQEALKNEPTGEAKGGAQEISGTWIKVGEQKGSNPGGTYRDEAGNDWYVKTPKTEDHARNEVLANRLYQMAGADVPEVKLATLEGKPAVASRMLTAATPLGKLEMLDKAAAVKKLRQNFAADAWLANHDVIGLNEDNILVDPMSATRIDQGGALRYRAQGEPKEGFGPKVAEFESMRDPKIAPQAAAVFKGMTKNQLVDSINNVLLVPTKDIEKAVGEFGPTDAAEASKLVDTLLDRQAHLAQIRQQLLMEKPGKPKAATETATTMKFPKGGGGGVVKFPKSSGEASKPFTFPAESVDKAKALGFHLPGDTETDLGQKLGKIWFHGTHSTFDQFDLAHAGKKWGQKKEKAVFLTPETKVAKAAAHGGIILPLVTRAQKVMIVPGPQNYSSSKFAAKIQEAHAQGYDAVLFERTSDFGVEADQLAVLKPNMIRSIHAKFEPGKAKSSKLAAIEGQKQQAPELQAIEEKKPGGEPAEAGGLAPEEFDRHYEEMLAEARNDMVEAQDRGIEVTEPTTPQELQAIAKRKSGQTLAMELQRQAAGTPQLPTVQSGQGGAAPPLSPQQQVAIRSLQQQVMDLAKALDFPVHEGRVQLPRALATYNVQTGVARTREIADFEAVSHEAGHAIEAKVGADLTNLINAHAAELGPLDYNYPTQARPAEGFAEYVRYMLNNNYGQTTAPNFAAAFEQFMTAEHPDILATLKKAGDARRAYNQASSVDAVGAVRRSSEENLTGFSKLRERLREEGFPAVIKSFMQNAYDAVLDDKAPVTRAVRDIARSIRDVTGAPVDLKAADNPDVLFRLLGRARQAAVRDMMDGVRPHREVTSRGPSLSGALTLASGKPSVWGAWDPEKKADFSSYTIARRAEYLWRKYNAGELPNPPVAFRHGDAVKAMADFERANPNFRQASDMVHGYARELLRKQFDAGLIDADLYDKLQKEEFYVPFMRDMSDKPIAGTGGGGGGAEGPGTVSTVKRITGSTRDIKDPIESLMMQTFLVNRTIRHNEVIRSFVDLAKKATGAGGRYVEPIPAHEAKRYTVDVSAILERKARDAGMTPNDAKAFAASVGNTVGGDPILGSYFKMEQANAKGEPIVFYKDGGKLKAARFMSKDEGHALYETLTAAPEPVTDMWVQLIGAAASLKRSGIITNPMFALTNYVRDQVAASLLRSDYVPFVGGVRGIADEFRQAQNAVLYGYAGGVAGGASTGPVEHAAKLEIDALAKKGYLVNRLSSFKGLMELANFTEAGTRNSIFSTVYDAKIKQGLSPYEAMIEAAFQAQDLLDFSRHGSRTILIRNLLPFLNAHIQGLDKAYRTAIDPIINRLKGDQVFVQESAEFKNALGTMLKAGALGGGLGAVWAAIMWEHEAYRDANPYFKGTHLVVPFGNKMFVVPKPFELGLGFTAGEYAFARLMEDDQRAGRQFMEAAWQSLQPPNPIADIPLISTATELALGKSLFTGRDIVPGELQRLPAPMQFNDRTSELAKWLGQVTGLSPMKIEYGIGAQFGNWGRDVMALSQGVNPDAPALNWDDAIFLRRLIKDPTRSSDITTRFWDYMGQTTGKFQQDVAAYDGLVKGGSSAKDFLDKLPAAERAFVTMKSAAKEDGRPAFSADDKRLHPLQRALDAVTMLNGLRKELAANTFRDFETLNRLKLDPTKRRDLIENIRELAQMEMRNSLVIMKEPGYATRPLLDPNDTMDKIVALSPEIGTEIATRYATARIYTTAAVQKAWPQFRDELVRSGSGADVHGLAIDAKLEGYEFGGDRAKRPQKRRVIIEGAAAH